MQRFASQMIMAFHRKGFGPHVIIGELHDRPAWLQGVSHEVVIPRWMANWMPRPLLTLARITWLQIVFPLKARRRSISTLIALAHEVAPYPLLRQISVAHDLTSLKTFSERDGIVTRLRNALWQAGLKRSEAIVAISEATRRDLLDSFGLEPASIYVIYEGVDRSLFAPEKPSCQEEQAPQRRFLFYVGTLDPHKNVPFLLDVYRRLRERFGAVDLKLAGRYTPDQVADLLKGVPEPSRDGIHLLGFVDDEELATLLARCAAFVFPSRNEGFGLAAVEAMACGAPVVSSSAGSLPEVVGDGGVLLSPDDVDAWVAELTRVLSDEPYRRALSQRAYARSQAFSWDEAAEAYVRLLQAA